MVCPNKRSLSSMKTLKTVLVDYPISGRIFLTCCEGLLTFGTYTVMMTMREVNLCRRYLS